MTDPIAEIAALAKRVAGIDLPLETKRSLIESRLARRIASSSGGDVAAYVRLVAQDASERGAMIDLLTTNHTFWMREPAHFDDLAARVIPAVLRRPGVARLRLWCAAAATGEEPYGIALTACEAVVAAGLARTVEAASGACDLSILATDISTRALDRARAARFDDERLAQLAPDRRDRALDVVDAGPPRLWQVKPGLRRCVAFAQLNLMDPWPMRGPFDAIFCRNVMIYFDRPTQERLVNRLAELLAPGGTLYVGHSESLNGLSHPLRLHMPACYVR